MEKVWCGCGRNCDEDIVSLIIILIVVYFSHYNSGKEVAHSITRNDPILGHASKKFKNNCPK